MKTLVIFTLLLAMVLPTSLFAVEPMNHPQTSEPGYWLSEEDFDKTIVKAEQAKRLEEELVKALTQLERERRWKRFTLSLTLPLAGAFIGDQINNDYGVYIGLGVGGLASWLISTLSN